MWHKYLGASDKLVKYADFILDIAKLKAIYTHIFYLQIL